MSVGLQDIQTGTILPGLITATVINFSPQGACLIVPKMTIDGKHLFYNTLNSDSHYLRLSSQDQNGIAEEFTIAARSVWMDVCDYQGKPAFKIGIHFLDNQKDLYNLLKETPPLL